MTVGVLRRRADIQTFDVPGTARWIRPATCSVSMIIVVGGGGGGAGGGRSSDSATIEAYGGPGGGGGGLAWMIVPTDLLAETEDVVVGYGGGGGSANLVDDTGPAPGTDGGYSAFGGWVMATAGAGAPADDVGIPGGQLYTGGAGGYNSEGGSSAGGTGGGGGGTITGAPTVAVQGYRGGASLYLPLTVSSNNADPEEPQGATVDLTGAEALRGGIGGGGGATYLGGLAAADYSAGSAGTRGGGGGGGGGIADMGAEVATNAGGDGGSGFVVVFSW